MPKIRIEMTEQKTKFFGQTLKYLSREKLLNIVINKWLSILVQDFAKKEFIDKNSVIVIKEEL